MAYVRKIDDVGEGRIVVQRLMDDGCDIIESSLPVLLTVVRELNVPRLPSLKGKMAAKKAEIKKLSASDVKKDRRMIVGTVQEQVDSIVKELLGLKCL